MEDDGGDKKEEKAEQKAHIMNDETKSEEKKDQLKAEDAKEKMKTEQVAPNRDEKNEKKEIQNEVLPLLII
jgi:hypothetical protein